MSYVSNIKIERKVAALLIMLGLVTVGVAITGYRTINSVDEQYTVLSDATLPATTDLVRANRLAVQMMYAGYRAFAYEGNSTQAQNAAKTLEVAYEAGNKSLDEAAATDPALAEKMPELRALFEGLYTTSARAVQLGLANRVDEAGRVLSQGDEQLEELSRTYSTFNNERVEEGDRQTDELAERADSMSFWMLVISLLGVAGGVVVAVLATRTFIVAPLTRLQDTMRSLADGNNKVEVAGVERRDEVGAMAKAVLVFRDAAIAQEQAAAEKAKADADQKFVVDTVSENLASLSKGDLTADIRAEFPPSYEELRTNFNSALANLRELIGSVTESAASILTGSQEIAQASEDLARRTESNAASLEETSAAISQIDERLRASAVSAGHTVERADGAIATVSGGREVADEAVQAMGRVSESAKGIDSVIEGLDKIAFQTRVLAMNAAVEAGRAGEAGRGFAVVADLVGALAMRSEEEAKRAREQLTATQSDVIMAVEAVEKVDAALQNISGDVGQVHELLATMATDNQAQSSAITQIASAVGTMDESTQQNAAMVEETSAAARNLSTEVTALSDQASAFNVGKNERAPARSSNKAVKQASLSRSKPATYRSSVKPLAAAAVPTTAAGADWQQF